MRKDEGGRMKDENCRLARLRDGVSLSVLMKGRGPRERSEVKM